jgi:hypothetical protein
MSSPFTALKRLLDPNDSFGSEVSRHFRKREPREVSLGPSYNPTPEQSKDEDALPTLYSSVGAQEQSDIFGEIAHEPCFPPLNSNQPSALYDPKAQAFVDDMDMADRRSAHSLSVASMLDHKPAIGLSVDQGTLKVLSNRAPSDLSRASNRNVCLELSAIEGQTRRTSVDEEIEEYVDTVVEKGKRGRDPYSYYKLTKGEAKELEGGHHDVWNVAPKDWKKPLAW